MNIGNLLYDPTNKYYTVTNLTYRTEPYTWNEEAKCTVVLRENFLFQLDMSNFEGTVTAAITANGVPIYIVSDANDLVYRAP